MMVRAVLRRRFVQRARAARHRMRLIALGRLSLLLAALQASAHLAEQRADTFASGWFDRTHRLNLPKNLQNLCVHLLTQLFLGPRTTRIAIRLRLRPTVR